MSQHIIPIPRLEALPQVAASFATLVEERGIIAFWGGMGFGKTTFIKALARHWEVLDEVTSPTFSLINEYHTANGQRVYHMDFYRIESLDEAFDLGLEDYFNDPNARVLMEWPSVVEPLLPQDRLDVTLAVDDDGLRTISFTL
ncbi:MAG: tRNA (adenosine(37)-N6)-threonylcarbamoyltransferase complex ATPase subunit type 1 TsaE [Bacteroidetes bacterium]|nr:MAG: tRNA (adenosine(37)-N6)-threonylcarbamoyltransferase complex ATPase subunit type 1 TsaE [Bacteroidota bacterium]